MLLARDALVAEHQAMADIPLIRHHIGGKARDVFPERVGDVYDPATGAVTAQVAFAGRDVVDEAVSAARDALSEWRSTSLSNRARVMFAFRTLLTTQSADLARIITSEHGKVPADAEGEIARGVDVVEFACGIPHLLKGEFSENVSRGIDTYSLRQPVGVVAGITPFNFPAMVPMWMFPIAIACGNAFILKPSEKDPSAAIFLAELLRQAGLPDGVFNVVHGDKVAVDALLEHPGVDAISSVGSTPVARYIYETGTRYGKRVQALGGAKNHAVVLPDADFEATADALIGAAFGSAGERCMAISAVVAVGDAGDRLIPSLRERVGSLRVGPGADPSSDMGPLITSAHRDKVASYIETGLNEGASLVVDGRDQRVAGYESGFFLGASVFDHVNEDMAIYRDEIFGPVLSILRTPTFDDAIDIVNRNEYGNGTAIFTTSGSAARRFQNEVEVGMIGINVPIPVPMAYYSFGGWKRSLFGDAHMHGTDGVRFYTRLKAVTARWPEGTAGIRPHFPPS